MNPHAKHLRAAAKICLIANLKNIANTCTQAAIEIEALQQHCDNLQVVIENDRRAASAADKP